MKNLFIPYELALKLKEKGFDEPCLLSWAEYHDRSRRELMSELEWDMKDTSAWIDLHTPAPIYQQVVDWLLTKHNIHVGATFSRSKGFDCIVDMDERFYLVGYQKTEQEALTKGIEKALTLLP